MDGTGITIGAVVVPQGMAYAQLAGLQVQFGLYSSFMGVLIYWFFATSKDITIGVSSLPACLPRRGAPADKPSPWPSCRN
jgi:MFS superfamily sulfate permease-like transporter